MKKSRYEYPVPELQEGSYLSQAPGSGTLYEWRDPTNTTPLGTQRNVRIIGIFVRCTWTVQPTPLEVHLTIDGVVHTASYTDPVSNTGYFVYVDPSLTSGYAMSSGTGKEAFLVEGRAVKIEAEITGGTVSNLAMRVLWARW